MSLCAGNPGIFAVSSQCGKEDNPAGKELPPLSGSQPSAISIEKLFGQPVHWTAKNTYEAVVALPRFLLFSETPRGMTYFCE